MWVLKDKCGFQKANVDFKRQMCVSKGNKCFTNVDFKRQICVSKKADVCFERQMWVLKYKCMFKKANVGFYKRKCVF